jgi:hypothetical protein
MVVVVVVVVVKEEDVTIPRERRRVRSMYGDEQAIILCPPRTGRPSVVLPRREAASERQTRPDRRESLGLAHTAAGAGWSVMSESNWMWLRWWMCSWISPE